VSDFDSSVQSANRETGRLSMSYYSLIVWIALVTVALGAVAAAAFCRKLPGRWPRIQSGDVDVTSTVTDSEIGDKSPPSDVDRRDADKVGQVSGSRSADRIINNDDDADDCEAFDSRNLSVLQSVDETGDRMECIRL
jgi:hypothetical protein